MEPEYNHAFSFVMGVVEVVGDSGGAGVGGAPMWSLNTTTQTPFSWEWLGGWLSGGAGVGGA